MASLYFPQDDNELFYKYFHRLKNFVIQRRVPMETWELCQLIYSGMNNETWGEIENMTGGDFCETKYEENWDMFEWLAEDTRQWDLKNSSLRNCRVEPCSRLNQQNKLSAGTLQLVQALISSQATLQTTITLLQHNQKSHEARCQKILNQVEHMVDVITRLEERSKVEVCNDEFHYEYESEDEELRRHELKESPVVEMFCEEQYDGFFGEDENSFNLTNSPTLVPIDMSMNYIEEEQQCPVVEMVYEDDDGFFDDDDDCYNLSYSPTLVPEDVPMNFICVSNDDIIIDDVCLFNDERSDDLMLEGTIGELMKEEKLDELVNKKDGNVIFENEEVVQMSVEKDFNECLSIEAPTIVSLRDIHALLPFLFHPAYKEPYRDIEFIFERKGPDKHFFQSCISIYLIWFHLLAIYYYHLYGLFASLFDRLLRALSCSARDLY